MSTVILFDFKSSFSEPTLATFARNVLNRLKGNPHFSAIQSPLIDTELQNAVEQFETALQEAADRSRTKIAQKNVALESLIKILEKTANHVTVVAENTEALILEAGFNLRSRSRRLNLSLDQVSGQRARPGTVAGEAILEYRKVAGARLYAVEWSADNGENWTNGTYSSARQASVTGLPMRQDILLRVHALGAGQRKGPHSEPARLFLI